MDKQKDGRTVRPWHCVVVLLAGAAAIIWSGYEEGKTDIFTWETKLGFYGGLVVFLCAIGVLCWITMPSNNRESIE